MPTHPRSADASGAPNRSGVALILTLGLLSLLLLLAFAFAVTMQTERIGSTTSTDGAQARLSIMQAFAIAARDIAYHIGIYPPRQWSPPRTPPSAWTPGGQYSGGSTVVDGFGATGMDWIPVSKRAAALSIAATAQWRTMFSLNRQQGYLLDPPGHKDARRGDFVTIECIRDEPVAAASVAINCSGFLDPHVVGRKPRGYGTGPAEIRPGFASVNLATMANKFTTDKPAECYAELTERFGRGTGGDPSGRFFHYSHFPSGQYLRRPGQTPAMTNTVALVGDASGIRTPYRDLERAFEDAGFYRTLRAPYTSNSVPSRTITRWLIRTLGDYVDADHVPGTNGNVAGVFTLPCQEAVPMLNEIRVQNAYTCRATANPTNYEFTIEPIVQIELWTPHTNVQSYVRLSVEGDVTLTPRGWLTLKLPAQSVTMGNAAPVSMRQREFRVVANTIAWEKPLFFTNTFLAGRTVTYDLTLANQRLRNLALPAGRNEVDRVPGAFPTLSISNSLPAAPPPGGETRVTNTVVIECLDPRFNWDPRDRRQADPLWQWRVTNSPALCTLGGLNRWTQEYFADRPRNGSDGDDVMYCRNKPLAVPGELGYLAYFPWKTVRLFDETGRTNYHRVLDTFTITNAVSIKGLVNPNSEYADVLASAFNEMPVDDFPLDPIPPNAFRLSTNLALRIGVAVTNYTLTHFLLHVSELGNVTDIFGDPAFLTDLGATTEFKKEALLRNSSCLFNTRQMMFTVLLASSYVSAHHRFGGVENSDFHFAVDQNAVRSSERRAVSVFWFDAYTGESFVRFFKYLDN